MIYTHTHLTAERFVFYFANFDKNLKILEIGAGNGGAKKWFEQMGFKDYTGIDSFVQYHRTEEPVIKMDAENMEFPDNTFDIVFMSHTAEHFINPIKAFKEIHRVMKSNGYLLSVTPYCCEHQIFRGDTDHIFVLNEMQIRKILEFAGFKDITTSLQSTYKNHQISLEQDYQIWSEARK